MMITCPTALVEKIEVERGLWGCFSSFQQYFDQETASSIQGCWRSKAWNLPHHLIHLIATFVVSDSPMSIINIALVCREFYKAMELNNEDVHGLWERLLVASWHSKLLDSEDDLWKLPAKHVYERRFLQIILPIVGANNLLWRSSDEMKEPDSIDEVNVCMRKLSGHLESGRLSQSIALIEADEVKSESKETEHQRLVTPIVENLSHLFSTDESEALSAVKKCEEMLSTDDTKEVVESIAGSRVIVF
jgi:hypothetical protein